MDMNNYMHCVVILNRMVKVLSLMNPSAFGVKIILLEDFVMNAFQDIFIKRLENHLIVSSKL